VMGALTRARTTGSTLARGGFTLTELLVVIGIAVLLLAMMIPTGQALREGNRALTCKAQLQQIGVALKAYTMDEAGGVPPYYIAQDEDPTDPETYPPSGPGLMQLYLGGYLPRVETLHCPRDVYASEAGSDAYYQSYSRYDEDAAANVPLNRYSYLSTRGITDDTDPLYRRQLQPAADVDGDPSTVPMPVVLPTWRPSDSAVVTWCSFHVDAIEMGGVGQYQVLFWDGSVRRVGENVMRDPAVGPDAAWKVSQSDATG
jgi:prepilin-type N-terminal cleavage/methylation domain-containing protein